MRYFPKNLFCTICNLIEMLIRLIPSQSTRVGTWRIVLAVVALNLTLASLANAQGISPSLPNPIRAPNPLTTTISIFRSNMQDKIMKSAEEMPESKYSYQPTKDVRSFAEILNHVADISYILCSNAKGEVLIAQRRVFFQNREGNCRSKYQRGPRLREIPPEFQGFPPEFPIAST
jgi:hypothetical protein